MVEVKDDLRVIKGTFEPLDTRGHQSVLLNNHQVPRQGADTLASHGVPLVRHRTRTDLVLLEGFLDLFEVREQSNVGSDFVSGSTEGSEGSENVNVDLAGVGLTSDRIGVLEPRELRNEFVELFDLKEFGISGGR